MAFPPSLPTRQVSFGSAVILEDGTLLRMVVEIQADKSLTWKPTGQPLVSYGRTFSAEEGAERTMPLPVTDAEGYINPDTRQPVDVSDGKQSHSYSGRVVYYLDKKEIKRASFGPFVLPADDGSVVDIDTIIPFTGPTGVTFFLPDIWTDLVERAEAAAAAAAVSADEAAAGVAVPAAFIGSEISREGSPAGEAVIAKIAAAVPVVGASAFVGRQQQLDVFGRLLSTLAVGEESVGINVISDSTSTTAGKTRWPRLLATRLAALFPAYAVQVVTYNDSGTTTKWSAPVVVSGDPLARSLTLADNSGLRHPGTGEAITGSCDIRARITFPTWPLSTTSVIYSNSETSANFATSFGISSSNKITLQVHDGTATPGIKSSDDMTSIITQGVPIWLRATFDATTGEHAFYSSTDGRTYTARGVAASTATALRPMSQHQIGAVFNGGASVGKFAYHEIEVRNGINGPSVVPRYADNWSQVATGIGTNPTAGKPVLTISVAGIPGASIDFLTDPARKAFLADVSWNQVVHFLASSHNDGNQRGPAYLAKWDTLLATVRGRSPYADVVLVTENPRTPGVVGYVTQHRARVGEQIQWARSNRLAVIDVFKAFKTSGIPLGSLNDPDGIHPTDALGSPLWEATVARAMVGG